MEWKDETPKSIDEYFITYEAEINGRIVRWHKALIDEKTGLPKYLAEQRIICKKEEMDEFLPWRNKKSFEYKKFFCTVGKTLQRVKMLKVYRRGGQKTRKEK